jgi:hypothetical protein
VRHLAFVKDQEGDRSSFEERSEAFQQGLSRPDVGRGYEAAAPAQWEIGLTHFSSSAHRQNELRRIANFYNGVRPHKAIGGLTSEGKLIQYFYPEKL